MLKDIVKLKIKGGIFKEESTLPFLEKEIKDGERKGEKIRAQGAIVYGRNGSGKSTISNAFLAIKNGGMPGIDEAQLIGIDGKEITLTENERKHIFVFNEEFIDKKVKIDRSGIDTIVMLGPTIGKEKELDEAKKKLADAELELDRAKKTKEKFEEKNGDDNPETIIDKIKKELKKKDGWADREKQFEEAGRVTDTIWREIAKLIVSETQLTLNDEFLQEVKKFKAAKSGESKIEGYISNISINYNEKTIIDLLGMKVEKPELTEREQWLINLSVEEVKMRKRTFESPGTKVCPFCGRNTEDDFKKELIKSFNKKLSKDVEEHTDALSQKQAEVEKISMTLASLQLDNFKSLPEYANSIRIIENINKIVEEIITQLDEKIHNPHSAILMSATDMDKLISELNDSLEKIKSEQEEHNKKVSDIDAIVARLKEINKKIAYYEIKDLYFDYKKKTEEQKNACDDYKAKEQKKAKCEAEQKRLEKEKDALKPDIAVKIINEYLDYIFVSEERLKIVYDEADKSYKLYSRNNPINPKQASIGERNIIALCYFFASILEGKERKEAFKEEYLFIIDDPISSFDVGNKVGLMSFIRMMINEYSSGNKDTGFVITTHDIKTSYDLEAGFSEIRDTRSKWNYNKFEIQNQKLKNFGKDRNEYSELLRIVFKYAQSPIEDKEAQIYDIFIGNIMRQVLESYATFTYGLGMSQLTTDKHALGDIPEEYRPYFYNRMYRLLLNGGSHKQEDIQANDDSTYYSKMTIDEKHAVSRDVICLLYEMNPGHLFAHLKGSRTDNENIIRPWADALPKEKH